VRKLLPALFGIIQLGAPGCTFCDPGGVGPGDNNSDANLTYTESDAHWKERLQGPTSAHQTGTVKAVNTGLPDSHLIDVIAIASPFQFDLQFDRPAQAGTYRVEDLHGLAEDSGSSSQGALAGTLTVKTVVAPCGNDNRAACSRLDASLLLTPVSGGPGPWVTGFAKLNYSEYVVPPSGSCLAIRF
jgi:hypothetical protein